MIRPAALVLALAAVAPAGGKIVLVDGGEIPGGRLLDGNAQTVRIELANKQVKTVPTSNLVAVTEAVAASPRSPHPFNLYLRNGDRLRGKVRGDGEMLALDGPGVLGFEVSLNDVRAVRFGRLLVSLEVKYSEVFQRELVRGRDVVIVQRETRPFPIYARVLSLGEKGLVVRVGEDKRELPYHKTYGFVRTVDDEPEATGVRARLKFVGGGRVTVPLEKITADAIVSGRTRILRSHVEAIEFLGEHIAHLSDFDPIAVKEVALFGKAPRWRRDGMVLGGPLRLMGKTYERGIGAQSYSRLEFVLGGRWNHFFARCGIDDAAGREGDAIFRVHGDGKLLEEIHRRRGEAPAPLRLDVKGVDRLVLEVAPGDSYISDFCDWAEARVFNASPTQD